MKGDWQKLFLVNSLGALEEYGGRVLLPYPILQQYKYAAKYSYQRAVIDLHVDKALLSSNDHPLIHCFNVMTAYCYVYEIKMP